MERLAILNGRVRISVHNQRRRCREMTTLFDRRAERAIQGARRVFLSTLDRPPRATQSLRRSVIDRRGPMELFCLALPANVLTGIPLHQFALPRSPCSPDIHLFDRPSPPRPYLGSISHCRRVHDSTEPPATGLLCNAARTIGIGSRSIKPACFRSRRGPVLTGKPWNSTRPRIGRAL